MEKDIQRRNVIDVLWSMDVGAIEVFPIVQKPSVTNTLNARLYKEKAEGMEMCIRDSQYAIRQYV